MVFAVFWLIVLCFAMSGCYDDHRYERTTRSGCVCASGRSCEACRAGYNPNNQNNPNNPSSGIGAVGLTVVVAGEPNRCKKCRTPMGEGRYCEHCGGDNGEDS